MDIHLFERWLAVMLAAMVTWKLVAWYGVTFRREAMMRLAKQWGWTFAPIGDVEVEQEAAALPLFQRGRDRRLTSAMAGMTDRVATHLFDYEFTIAVGRSLRTYRQTVAAVAASPAGALPAFELCPNIAGERMSALYGYREIAVPEHQEFSRRYTLRGSTDEAVRRLFHLELLHHVAVQPGWSVEGVGEWVVCYRAGHLVAPQQLETFRRDAFQLAQLVARNT